MPPKNKSLEDLVAGISDKLDAISEQLDAVREQQDTLDGKFERLEELLRTANAENALLKKENVDLKSDVSALKEKVNNLEQRNRSSCVRIFNVPITGDSSNNGNVATQVYQKILYPILNGATTSGLVEKIPTLSDTIESAHILPGPKSNKPILCRFKSNRIKQIVMQSKKEYAPRMPSLNDKLGPFIYPLYDDITRDAYALMKKLGADVRVQAAWFANGSIRFRLNNSDTIHRVYSIFGPYEDHFKK